MKKVLSGLLLIFSLNISAQLASWDLESLTGIVASASTLNVASGVQSAVLTRGAGLVASSGDGVYNAYSWATTTTPGNTDFFQITVTLSPTSQPISSFGSIAFYITSTQPGPKLVALRSQHDGFMSNIDGEMSIDGAGSGFAGYVSFDLSTLPQVAAGGSVILRLYGYDASNTNSGAQMGIGDGYGGETDIIFTATLPVKLVDFETRITGGQVLNRWSTDSEKNSDRFEIERSTDGRSFTKIGAVAAAGESVQKETYEFSDKNPVSGKAFYRLKQLDKDGKASYSRMNTITFGEVSDLLLFPSPVRDVLYVRFDQSLGEEGRWEIWDLTGKLLLNGQVSDNTALQVDVNNLEKGSYIFRASSGSKNVVKQFVK